MQLRNRIKLAMTSRFGKVRLETIVYLGEPIAGWFTKPGALTQAVGSMSAIAIFQQLGQPAFASFLLAF
jgi:hypothetical protein